MDEAKELCEQFNIRSYPSLVYLRGNMRYNFRHPRKLEKFIEFVTTDLYLETDEEQKEEIPRRLEGFEKLKKNTGGLLADMSS